MRCAIVASFVVIDTDKSGSLSPDEMIAFAQASSAIRMEGKPFDLHPDSYVECMEQVRHSVTLVYSPYTFTD